MYHHRVATLACSIVLLQAVFAVGQQTSSERLVRRMGQPVFAASAAGRENQLFVLEKASGRIRILDTNSKEILEDDFLRVPRLETASEAGLLGMAFHPEYADNGKFYVYASRPGGGGHHQSNILEYTIDGDPLTSNTVDVNSERTILQFDQPFANHNGGWIGFNPVAGQSEGAHLYISTGDGGSGGDPQNNSQDTTDNLLGKILRIDVDSDDFATDSNRNYGIPASNPHVDSAVDDEIFAHGLRNPWRASFDRQTGDLWIGDVGQGAREEVDLIPAGSGGGQNFGWRVMEGDSCFVSDDDLPCDSPVFTEPVVSYQHGSGPTNGRSITGGYLYRGSLKEFQGHYFFADFVSANVWTMDPYSGHVTNQNDAVEADSGAANAGIASFAEDANGELYLVTLNSGSVYGLRSSSRDARWDGLTSERGASGDGVTWADAANWSRDGVADVGFVEGDHLILGNVSLTTDAPRRVSALTFEADAEFSTTAELNVVSGNVFVEGSAHAQLRGSLDSDVRIIRKFGSGRLELLGDSTNNIVLLEGDLSMEQNPAILQMAGGRYLANGEGKMAALRMTGGTLELTAPEVTEEQPIEEQAVLEITRDITFAGNLSVNLSEDFVTPDLGATKSLPLINSYSAPDIDGEFAATLVDGKPTGHLRDGLFVDFAWTDLERGQLFVLNVTQQLTGDANLDGQVDFGDFLLLSSKYGLAGVWSDGDFTGDGTVDFADFLELSDHFGSALPQLVESTQAAVPEPAAFPHVASVLILAGLLRLRRR